MIKLIQGEANRIPLAHASVDCVVTSPPYFGLRDYGIPASIWGGDATCEHDWGEPFIDASRAAKGEKGSTLADGGANHITAARFVTTSSYCSRCNAWRGQLGHETHPDKYIEHICEVFEELWRVLKPEGTCWLNLGDSYAGSWGARGRGPQTNAPRPDMEAKYGTEIPSARNGFRDIGIKTKDLIGIPWMTAIALRSRGWYLRSDIIWVKPNGMPESVEDRPTRAHEYVFLLTKQEKYYYDAAAIRTSLKRSSVDRLSQDVDSQAGTERANGGTRTERPMKAVARTDKQRGHSRRHDGFNKRWDSMTREEQQAKGANARSWWNIATQPFKGAHFATMPEALARRCIMAGCPAGGIVLDPFTGSGTTGVSAFNSGRNFVGLERGSDYLGMMNRRLPPLFAQ